jgi:hypothetical protein
VGAHVRGRGGSGLRRSDDDVDGPADRQLRG